MNKRRPTVAEYLQSQIALCGKSQKEIAEEVGYRTPNMITMLKLGHCRLPLDKIGPISKALHVEASVLTRLVVSEYMPELWQLLVENFKIDKVSTEQDHALIALVREATGEVPLRYDNPVVAETISKTFKSLTNAELSSRDTAVRNHASAARAVTAPL